MRNFCNLNIKSADKKFNYYLEIADNEYEVEFDNISYSNKNNIVEFVNPLYHNVSYNMNYYTTSNNLYNQEYIPEFIDTVTAKLYIPVYNISIYEKQVDYVIVFRTYICEKEIILGSYLVDYNQISELNKSKSMIGNEYYESFSFEIINPHTIHYSDEWDSFRKEICGEYNMTNNGGANLNITLIPVSQGLANTYYNLVEYSLCQNTINISNSESDYLRVDLSMNNIVDDDKGIEFMGKIVYNNNYEQTFDGLNEYLKETYNIELNSLNYELVIKDNNNIYKYSSKESTDTHIVFDKHDIEFDNWNEYQEGCIVVLCINVNDGDINVFSNEISITKEIFKFLIHTKIDKINLDLVDMNIYNINAVNKIEKTVVKMERPSSYKNNIIKPVFFKVNELNDLKIHKNVIENISINLDSYKNKVEMFYLSIDNVLFGEIGRNSTGVIFRVNSNKLKDDVISGNYYILNQDSELITSGNYTVI